MLLGTSIGLLGQLFCLFSNLNGLFSLFISICICLFNLLLDASISLFSLLLCLFLSLNFLLCLSFGYLYIPCILCKGRIVMLNLALRHSYGLFNRDFISLVSVSCFGLLNDLQIGLFGCLSILIVVSYGSVSFLFSKLLGSLVFSLSLSVSSFGHLLSLDFSLFISLLSLFSLLYSSINFLLNLSLESLILGIARILDHGYDVNASSILTSLLIIRQECKKICRFCNSGIYRLTVSGNILARLDHVCENLFSIYIISALGSSAILFLISEKSCSLFNTGIYRLFVSACITFGLLTVKLRSLSVICAISNYVFNTALIVITSFSDRITRGKKRICLLDSGINDTSSFFRRFSTLTLFAGRSARGKRAFGHRLRFGCIDLKMLRHKSVFISVCRSH